MFQTVTTDGQDKRTTKGTTTLSLEPLCGFGLGLEMSCKRLGRLPERTRTHLLNGLSSGGPAGWPNRALGHGDKPLEGPCSVPDKQRSFVCLAPFPPLVPLPRWRKRIPTAFFAWVFFPLRSRLRDRYLLSSPGHGVIRWAVRGLICHRGPVKSMGRV